MKCLTVRQPWAWGIVSGPKDIENRSRLTRHRGDLLIHAGVTRAEFDGRDFSSLMRGLPPIEGLAFGAIIGVVRVIDCVPYADVAGRPFAEPGGWCWLLDDPRPLDRPIPWRGQLGLFEVPDEVVRQAIAKDSSLELESTIY